MFGLVLLAVVGRTLVADLFAFRDAARHVLVFAVPGIEPIPATVDQTAATPAALDGARRFYEVADLDGVDVEFATLPTRFWRVTFSALERGQTMRLYAVVLPDSRPVEPAIRDETQGPKRRQALALASAPPGG